LGSRHVQDKKQVADFDPQEWLDEHPEEEEIQIPCPVCNLADQEEILLLCDGCDTPYHTHCVGLDSVPSGSWFCMECVDALGVENETTPSPPSNRHGNRWRPSIVPRTQANTRRARQRARVDEWHGAWGRITGRIFDAINIDLDDQGDDDDPSITEGLRLSQHLREQDQRERERWQQRLNIASRMGAGNIFARNIPDVYGRIVPPLRPSPPQEPQEVRLAWGALDKARDLENRKRKSRSGTVEPSEPHQEPERKLKRPRTRRLPPQNGESSSSAANHLAGPSNQSDLASPTNTSTSAPEAPSFLSALLREVEMSTPSDEEKIQALYGRIPGANDAPSPPANSPSRASSITPPPHPSVRSTSPAMSLSSHIEPIYPPANYSPTRSSSTSNKHSRSSSPSKRVIRDTRSSPENSDTEHRGHSRNGTSELRQPQPRRTHPIVVPAAAENVSPSRSPLPLELKESISSLVRSALKPHWKSNKLTSEQYASINRDISRKIYEQVENVSAVGDSIRRDWEKLATSEVARAVADLKA